MKITRLSWLTAIFSVLVVCYSLFSFSLTDPNLVLTSWKPYWQFQQWMWQTVFADRQLLTAIYIALVSILFVVYGMILKASQGRTVTKSNIYCYGLIVIALFFSYNALSHDVFNYIFNAKLVAVYQQNPHVETALNYPNDLWTRFMHNTHTTAPYGYGWTLLSLIPFFLGGGKFLSTWLFFRIFEVVGVALLYVVLQRLSTVLRGRELYLSEAVLLFLNPLFLIEVVSNMHNDLWMMVPALVAVLTVLEFEVLRTTLWKVLLLTGSLLLFSVSIKYATVVLLPVLLFIFIARSVIFTLLKERVARFPFSNQLVQWGTKYLESWWKPYVPLVCSILLFIPLFTGRSQLFHPWYLLWSLCWIPLVKQRWWKTLLLGFSFSSLLRYVPWLWIGDFAGKTLLWQQVITWSIPLIIFSARHLFQQLQNKKNFSLYND